MLHKKHPDSAPILHKLLHILERAIAIITLVVLVGMLFITLYDLGVNSLKLFTSGDTTLLSVEEYLHSVLTIVVGLEFVRMLLDMTPANTIEVLIVAISRQVILNHDNPLSNLACIACIAGLFATRRFLIPKQEMKIELSEVDEEEEVEI